MKFTLSCLLWSTFFAAITSAAGTSLDPFFRPGVIRVLILSGRNNHDWRTTTPHLRKLLIDTGRFNVRVCEEPVGSDSAALAPYHALVIDYQGPRWGAAAEKAVEEFLKGGKGMVVVHGSAYAFSGLDALADHHKTTGIKEAPWIEYSKMVGGSWTQPPAIGFHGPRWSFSVKIVDSNHPIFQGIRESFIATDDLYREMKFLPQAHVLATVYDVPAYQGNGTNEPMLVITSYGSGSVFYTALGHEVPAMSESGFITTYLRGVEWAATGKVTLTAEIGDLTPAADALKVLVVTGDINIRLRSIHCSKVILTCPGTILSPIGKPSKTIFDRSMVFLFSTTFLKNWTRIAGICAISSSQEKGWWFCMTPLPTTTPGPGGFRTLEGDVTCSILTRACRLWPTSTTKNCLLNR